MRDAFGALDQHRGVLYHPSHGPIRAGSRHAQTGKQKEGRKARRWRKEKEKIEVKKSKVKERKRRGFPPSSHILDLRYFLVFGCCVSWFSFSFRALLLNRLKNLNKSVREGGKVSVRKLTNLCRCSTVWNTMHHVWWACGFLKRPACSALAVLVGFSLELFLEFTHVISTQCSLRILIRTNKTEIRKGGEWNGVKASSACGALALANLLRTILSFQNVFFYFFIFLTLLFFSGKNK